MAHKGPHISISPDYVVNRILRINIDDFAEWPESVRHLAIAIAEGTSGLGETTVGKSPDGMSCSGTWMMLVKP